MTRYADLPSYRRNEPCEEYPGEWLVFANGEQAGSFPTRREAMEFAMRDLSPDATRVSIGWAASPDDPRHGKVWFTGFYCDPVDPFRAL